MSLAARITESTPKSQHGLPCSVGVLLNTLEGDELDALILMLGNPEERNGWSASAIYDALTAEGYAVGQQTITRHRRGRCRCGR
jgi:hypothetical protein